MQFTFMYSNLSWTRIP